LKSALLFKPIRKHTRGFAAAMLVVLFASACGEAESVVMSSRASDASSRPSSFVNVKVGTGFERFDVASLVADRGSAALIEPGSAAEGWTLADGEDARLAEAVNSRRVSRIALGIKGAVSGNPLGTVDVIFDAARRLQGLEVRHNGKVISLDYSSLGSDGNTQSIRVVSGGTELLAGVIASADRPVEMASLEAEEGEGGDITACLMAIANAVANGLITAAAAAGAVVAFQAGQIWLGRFLLGGMVGAAWLTSGAIVEMFRACGVPLPGTARFFLHDRDERDGSTSQRGRAQQLMGIV
jgi:hypothetical protein